MGLSAIPRGGKSIPALGGGARHPRQQAASLPGERGGRIHRWQGSRAGGGRQPGKGILFSPRLSGCQRRWMHLDHSTHSLRPAASPSGDPQPACCKHTHSTRTQAWVREDIYLRNNSLGKGAITRCRRERTPASASPDSWVFSDSRLHFLLQTNTPLPSLPFSS